MVKWTASRIRTAKSILRRHSNYIEAVAEIAAKFGEKVTPGGVGSAFRNSGQKDTPQSLLKPHERGKEFWITERIEEAQEILGRHADVDGALAEMVTKWQRPIAKAAIDQAFHRVSLPASQHFLMKPEIHPVAARAAKDKESHYRRQHGQMVEELAEYQARQDFIDEAEACRPPPRIMPREKTSGLREATAVVMGSDWHVEEPVEPEMVAGVNEYNLDIAERRVKRFWNGIIWQVEHHRASQRIAIRDVIAWLGGDLMTGYIHPELIENNDLSPTQTILWLTPLIINGLLSVVEHLQLERLVVPCSYGNHGRTTDKPRIATSYKNSFEWLMYHQLAAALKHEKRIRFEITSSQHQYVQAYDWMLHFHHGDDVKYNGGVGGLGVPLLKRIPKWDSIKRSDYHHVGHFHQYLDYGRVVVNGSLIGYGPFSQRIGAEFEEPQQAFYLLDSKRGKCQKTPLWVGEDTVKSRKVA
jgi:hypothetical protein